jgi:(R,R)-butanediol dehydrogenase / meso-butanediol dehydrogenase / diacetyl reductase
MRAVRYQGAHTLTVDEASVPTLGPGQVLIRVAFAGMCGTDVHIYEGLHPRARPGVILGHEISGEVVAVENRELPIPVGTHVVVEPLLACGRCVACREGNYHLCREHGLLGIDANGGFAEFVAVSSERIHPVPAGVDLTEAALVEPLAVAIHAVRRGSVAVGDHVLVFGAGPIGLLTALAARSAGAALVVVSEVVPFRLSLARKLGFLVVDAAREGAAEVIRDLTGGLGADVVFDAAAAPATATQWVPVTKPSGTIVALGIFTRPAPVDLGQVTRHELRILGTRDYTFADFRRALELLESKRIDVRELITEVTDLGEAERTILRIKAGKDVMKVLLAPAGGVR